MSRTAHLPEYFFFTDRKRVADWAGVCQTLPPGAGVVLRDYTDPERGALATALAQLCLARGLTFLVGGDPELAVRLKAGLHCPQAMMPRLRRRFGQIRAANPTALITAAAHSPTALHTAAEAGLDAAFLSPVFATQSGPEKRPLGPVRTARWITDARLPVLALGGMSADADRRLHGVGHHGYAAIGAWLTKSV